MFVEKRVGYQVLLKVAIAMTGSLFVSMHMIYQQNTKNRKIRGDMAHLLIDVSYI